MSIKYVKTAFVKEVFRGAVVWEGEVLGFDLIGHPKSKKAFAWGHLNEKGGWEITTVLEIPPVTLPQTAIKVAIAAAGKLVRGLLSGLS